MHLLFHVHFYAKIKNTNCYKTAIRTINLVERQRMSIYHLSETLAVLPAGYIILALHTRVLYWTKKLCTMNNNVIVYVLPIIIYFLAISFTKRVRPGKSAKVNSNLTWISSFNYLPEMFFELYKDYRVSQNILSLIITCGNSIPIFWQLKHL